MPYTRDAQRLLVGILAFVLAAAALMTVPSVAQAAPAAPRSLSPNGAAVSGPPTLQWRRVSGAATYDVEVSASPTFSTLLFSVNTANRRAVPTVAMPAGDVYWRVRSVNRAGDAGSWAMGTLTVSQGSGPTLITPVDGDVLQQPFNPVVLSWRPLSGVEEYELEVDNAPDFVGAGSATVTTTSYLIQNPQPTTTFHWRVRGIYSGGGATRWSQTWSYSIPGLPEVDPGSVAPVDSGDSSNPTKVEDVVLDWDPVAGAKDYDIRVSTDREFSASSTVHSATVVSTRYSPPVTYDNNTYYWQVRARDVRGNVRPWNDVQEIPKRTFERHWPDQPELLHPNMPVPQLPLEVSDPFFFQWKPVDHASHYELQLGTNQEFSPLTFISCFTRATTYTPTGPTPESFPQDCMPVPGVTYFWRVRGLDGPNQENAEGGVHGRWSDIHTFQYLPGQVQTIAPLPGATVSIPTLRWEAAQDAEKYRVVVTGQNGSTQSATTHSLSWTPPNRLDPADGPFRWSVVAIDHNKVASPTPTPGSQPTFNLDSSMPTSGMPAMTPLAPTDNSRHTRFPALRWEPHPNATSYVIYVGAAGSSTVHALESPSGSTIFAGYPSWTDLNAGKLQPGRYRWYVEAYADGALLGEGADGTFEILDLAPVAGQQVALSGLDHDAQFCDRGLGAVDPDQRICRDLKQTPVLDWDPVPDASHYLVYLYHDRALTNDVYPGLEYVETQNTRWTPRSLLPESQAGDAYYWFVRPCKATSVCAPDPLSATHAFDKRSNPVEPLLTEPLHVTTPANELTLHWRDYLESNQNQPGSTGAQVTVEAQSYKVQISDDPTFARVLDWRIVDQTTYTPYEETLPEGPLYWRVRAIDGSDNELAWSDTVTVTKSSGAPEELRPASGATTDGTPFLRWAPMDFASSYEVEISTDKLFPAATRVLFKSSNQAALSLNDQLAASSTYWWRVRRVDAGGNKGRWSEPSSFRVNGEAPSLRSPGRNAYLEPTDAYFTWGTVPSATSYVFELKHASQGLLGAAVTVAPAYAPRTVLPQGSLSWRVTARDAAGRELDSTAWRSARIDTVRPRVRSKSPRRSPVSHRTNFKATFSEPVRRVSGKTMRLYQAGRRRPVAARLSSAKGGRVWTLNPRQGLKSRKRYTVKVYSGIRDKAGNRLRATSWRVTTRR